jgi:hypothetical protein
MEYGGSLPYTQEPATGFYPEPDNSIHTLRPYFFKVYGNTLGLNLIEILNVYTRSCY